eukprot:TRINITY_DN645_c0_g1_i1.p1 TRINITY_DN645_c0_g1~~TRINITY_DN645_c0_g1_i1.p1  ORF type:complete len:214 (-),score=27.74 TRINITY_DN645_c0_g1_i1:48-653(-)
MDQARCSNTECNSSRLVLDEAKGDIICRDCGRICSDKLISDDAEWRTFADDSSSQNRSRVGAAYSIDIGPRLTSKTSKYDRDDLEFLYMGLRDIETLLFAVLDGCGRNLPVENRAKSLFNQAFLIQKEQKEGKREFKGSKARERYARRKQYVVAVVYYSLVKNGIDTWKVNELSDQLPGRDVTSESVKKCLQSLDCYVTVS